MSRLTSIIKMTCPRCREGHLFHQDNRLLRPLAMHKECSVCGQSFSPEPGFYYGAMFISYVFIAFFSLGLVGFLVFIQKWSVEWSFGLLILCLTIMYGWNLRLSRSIWIHIVVKYNPTFAAARKV